MVKRPTKRLARARASAPKKPVKTAYHHGDLRRALLDAALAIVGTEGAQVLTLREVARRAGVSHAAPYRHFADKGAMLAAVAEEGFRALRASMLDVLASSGTDPIERFLACGTAYVAFATSHAAHYRVMFGQAGAEKHDEPTLHEAGELAFQVLLDCIAEGQAAGLMRPGDSHAIALAIWSLEHGLSMLAIDGQLGMFGDAPPGAFARRVHVMLLEGVGATAPRPRG